MAIQHRLALGEGAIHVVPHHLGACRNRKVCSAPRGYGGTANPIINVNVVTKRNGDHVEVVCEFVQAYADRLGALVDARANVDILLVPVLLEELNNDLPQLSNLWKRVHHQDLAGGAKAL